MTLFHSKHMAAILDNFFLIIFTMNLNENENVDNNTAEGAPHNEEPSSPPATAAVSNSSSSNSKGNRMAAEVIPKIVDSDISKYPIC